jgi:hypothetical protein
MNRLLPINRRNSISSVHSAAVPSLSRENSGHRECSPDEKENGRKKLSTTAEEDSYDENGVTTTRQHRSSGSGEQREPDAGPQFIVTLATEVAADHRTHAPAEIDLRNDPTYHLIREVVISDIIEHLRNGEHRSYPPALSHFSCPSLVPDIDGNNLDAYSQGYLRDPNYYNGSRGARRDPSSQRPNLMDPLLRLSAAGMSSSRSVLRTQPPSPHLRGREFDAKLSAILEAQSSQGISKSRTIEHVMAVPDSGKVSEMDLAVPDNDKVRGVNQSGSDADKVSELNYEGEQVYIPEFKWQDIKLWPGFVMTWLPFVWTCIQDSFSTNPYKLHPIVYLAMGFCLIWCIFVKWVLVCVAIKNLMMLEGWTKQDEAEARRVTDMTISILPYVVQLVLFLFPPLLASTS